MKRTRLQPPRLQDALTESQLLSRWQDPQAIKVSILCQTFNHRQFIESALASFFMQETDFAFEVLVFDDASTDGTTELVHKFASLYPTVMRPFIQTENQYSRGLRGMPQFLWPAARGDYVALCEGDDYWTDKNKLQKQVQCLENQAEFAICGHDAVVVDEQDQVLLHSKFPRSRRDISPDRLVAGRAVLLATNSYLIRRPAQPLPLYEFMRVTNGDRFLISWLSQFGGSKFLDNVEPAAYRVHAGGIWSSLPKGNVQRWENANTYFWLSKYYTRTGQPNQAKRCRQEFLRNVVLGMKPMEWVQANLWRLKSSVRTPLAAIKKLFYKNKRR